ncbi:MAG: redoxin domain-containing protein [Myxococcales bacterium]|nr:MAG: redoxin domain-containing protein [Myxococcales bacterium]
MSPLMERYGVTVLALSKDTPEFARVHRERDGLSFTLLTDPDVSIIKRFGLLHEGGLEFRTSFTVWGLPVGWMTRKGQMAITTTLLLDEEGIVRWIDQADDYRLRGDRARTENALKRVYGET